MSGRIVPARTSDSNFGSVIFIGVAYVALIIVFGAAVTGVLVPGLSTPVLIGLYLLNRPKYLLAPSNFMMAYSTLWNILPLWFASQYADYDWRKPEVQAALLMVSCTHIIGYTVLRVSEGNDGDSAVWRRSSWAARLPYAVLRRRATVCLFVAVVSAWLVISKSSGIAFWIEKPGLAFLTRQGTGVYNLIFIFTVSIAVAGLAGYSKMKRSPWWLPFLVVVMLILSPVFGGKSRMMMMILLMVSPWYFCSKLRIGRAFVLGVTFVAVIVSMNFYRNPWLLDHPKMIAPYLLNYFNTFDLLVLSIHDFAPFSKMTILLPFNKLLTPIGIGEKFYDVSSWLTSIYYPDAWRIRATQQWPIETDLYLSMGYYFGIPLLIVMFLLFGLMHRHAVRTRTLGAIFISLFASTYMVSHLRGGLIVWTDFYMVPFLACAYLFLRRFPMDSPELLRERQEG